MIKRIKELNCCCCSEKLKVKHFHRNSYSENFRLRNYYVNHCHICATNLFERVVNETNLHMGFIYICSLYDRKFNKSIVDKIRELNIPPIEKCQEYFRRLNLSQGFGRYDECTFIHSDKIRFICEKDY